MNKEARERFEMLVEMDPMDLTEDDIAFLRARRDYLSPVQREMFGEVLHLSADEMVLSKSQMKRFKELQKDNEAQAKREQELEIKKQKEREAAAKKLNGEATDDVEVDENSEAKEDDVEVMTSDDSGEVKPLETKNKKAKGKK